MKNIVDAGPIVALLNATEGKDHEWSRKQFARCPVFHTCEAVIAEACARLAFHNLNPLKVIQLLERGVLIVDFALNARAGRIAQLMAKYSDAPMDLADACLVAMTEETKNCQVVTLDHADFSFYRRNGREIIPFTSPEKN